MIVLPIDEIAEDKVEAIGVVVLEVVVEMVLGVVVLSVVVDSVVDGVVELEIVVLRVEVLDIVNSQLDNTTQFPSSFLTYPLLQ